MNLMGIFRKADVKTKYYTRTDAPDDLTFIRTDDWGLEIFSVWQVCEPVCLDEQHMRKEDIDSDFWTEIPESEARQLLEMQNALRVVHFFPEE